MIEKDILKTKPKKLTQSQREEFFRDGGLCVEGLINEDWVKKVQRDLKPVFLDDFVILNNHYLKKIDTNKIKINIEASMAFGTGHHGTTIGCLKAIEYLSNKNFNLRKFIDLGTGTGLLALGVSKRLKIKGIASDYDLISCNVAKNNVKKNGLKYKIIIRHSNGFKNKTIRMSSPFDLIISNILLKPLCFLAKEFRLNLKKKGFLILSGITNLFLFQINFFCIKRL